MSFNPDPRFVPAPGRPTAAPRPDFRVDGYGCWKSHRTMAEVMAHERRNFGLTYQEGIARTCVKCGAAPGRLCKMPSGHRLEGIHSVRRLA